MHGKQFDEIILGIGRVTMLNENALWTNLWTKGSTEQTNGRIDAREMDGRKQSVETRCTE